jgi:hypothetical protein
MSETISEQLEQEVQQNGDLLPPAPLPSIPVPTADPQSLLNAVLAIKKVLDAFTGAGAVQNRVLTVGDALTEGIATAAVANVQVGDPNAGTVFITGESGYVDPRPVLSVPPTLTALTAMGTFRAVVVQWDRIDYQNHSHAEVWRSDTNDLATAVLIGTAPADIYTDANVVVSTTYYYWVRDVGYSPSDGSPIVGAFNATAGTPGGAQLIGNTDLGPLIVEAANLADNAVTAVKITDDAITAPKLSANCIAVGTAAIENGAIDHAMMATAAIDTANIVDLAVQTGKIADAAITTAKIADLTVTTAKIVDAAITSAKIGTAAVGTAQIADASITTAKIASLTVTTGMIQDLAVTSAKIQDLRTTNYAEDGSGNPTAGAKLASTGTTLKIANSALQVGTAIFSDYWTRLVQAIDGSSASGYVIIRGNNDSTTRGGAPNIACLTMFSQADQVLNSNFQQAYFTYRIKPTTYTTYSDNLDQMTQIHIQFFQSTSSSSPFTETYQPCPSRTYDGATGEVWGCLSWGWRFTGTNNTGPGSQVETNNLYSGALRVRLANSYGWSATQDFNWTSTAGAALPTTTITGVSGSSGGGSGSSGGACPAPWVKVQLMNGTEVEAGHLHNGARVAAVNDSTLEPIPAGGVITNLMRVWARRWRVRLTDGAATEWSENHRLYVVGKGWTPVQRVRPGDHIAGQKECIVESVLMVGEGEVISYEVRGAGTYFAGGMLCHNYKAIP